MHDAGPAEQLLSHRHDLFNLFTVLELFTDFRPHFGLAERLKRAKQTSSLVRRAITNPGASFRPRYQGYSRNRAGTFLGSTQSPSVDRIQSDIFTPAVIDQ